MKKIKITKEQYNKILLHEANLIKKYKIGINKNIEPESNEIIQKTKKN